MVQDGFLVDGHLRQLTVRAGSLGFAELSGYLTQRLAVHYSIVEIAEELACSEWRVYRALEQLHIPVASTAQRRDQTRRRYTQLRLEARVAELGFANLDAYLHARLDDGDWLLSEVAVELDAAPATIRRFLRQAGITYTRRSRTARQRMAAAGRRAQRVSWQARRAARAGELGFASVEDYLRARRAQGWTITRIRRELRVGIRWLRGELTRLGMR